MEKSILLSPIKLGRRVSENRFAIHAMEGNNADSEGNPTEKTYRRYSRHFEGNAGVIFLESITPDYEHRGRLNQLSIMPHNQKALTKLVKKMKEINDKPLFLFQIAHTGEISNSFFSKRITVKPLPGWGGELISEDYAEKLIDLFVDATEIAYNAGADGVDIKLSHGYLGSQFLRPYNDRKWKYGGSWENRSRFAFKIYEKISERINDPDFIVGSKISVWEGFPGGTGTAGPDSAVMDFTEDIALIRGLEERGAKFFVASAGTSFTAALAQSVKTDAPYITYLLHTFGKVVRDAAKTGTVVIGCGYSVYRDGNNSLPILDKEKGSIFYWGEKNIKEGIIDIIGLGKQAYADSLLPKKFAEGRIDEINWCITCGKCIQFVRNHPYQKPSGCVVYEKEYARFYEEMQKEIVEKR